MTRIRNAEAKPLSFSTTMRNPDRIASFINQLIPFENQILTNELITKVVKNTIKNKLYRPMYVGRNHIIRETFDKEENILTDSQVIDIIKNSPQNHKEAGFDKGWPSRFDTWFKLPKEFGFIYYEMGKPIIISNVGHMLIDALNEVPTNEEKIQNVFLNSMMKYQSDNPFRKNLNSNAPLLLLLQLIKLMKNDPYASNDAGVFRQELSLLICWPNNDAEALYDKIKEIRKSVGFNYSDEYMYDICLDLLGATSDEDKESMKARFKMKQICGEAIDEYIRKMRSTGIISLRGNGRFLDYNSFEKEKISYVLENYSTYPRFELKEEYLKYMGEIDSNILSLEKVQIPIKEELRISTLERFAKEYSVESIEKELKILCTKREESKDPIFRFISAPARLEFLTSIALVQQFEGLQVLPNYNIDDEGLPTMTAGGDMADIVCVESEYDSLIEVTLMYGRQNQVNNEIIPIRRHLIDRLKGGKKAFSIFVAPIVHEDAKEAALWYKQKDSIDILTYSIEDFLNNIKTNRQLINLNV